MELMQDGNTGISGGNRNFSVNNQHIYKKLLVVNEGVQTYKTKQGMNTIIYCSFLSKICFIYNNSMKRICIQF